MSKASLLSAKILGGLLGVALSVWPQSYTISAKPGAVNYVEGNATLDGQSLGSSSLKTTFLNAGGLLETRDGKVEVLLTPGCVSAGGRQQPRKNVEAFADRYADCCRGGREHDRSGSIC
jgi:hypothetical protein